MKNLSVLVWVSLLFLSPAAAQQPAQPRLLTSQQIKNYWLNTFPQPNTLDRDFHQKKKEYAALIATIQAGKLDNQAERTALVNNLAYYQGIGDSANATITNQSIANLDAKIAEEQRLAEARAQRRELESIRISLQMLEQQNFLK